MTHSTHTQIGLYADRCTAALPASELPRNLIEGEMLVNPNQRARGPGWALRQEHLRRAPTCVAVSKPVGWTAPARRV
jgi:hypothetical protein